MDLADRPKLRPVEAFPVEADGQKRIALRDPAGFTQAVLVLPRPLLDIVSLFDGEHTLLDIQEVFMRRHGELLFRERLEEILAALDENGFLDSPAFAGRREAIEAAFRASPARPAVHAGSAYAAEPEALRRQIDGFFAPPEGPGAPGAAVPSANVQGIIAPHIDFHRGGPVYAWAYREVAERSDADLFVILGTCHAGMPDPFALTTSSPASWLTGPSTRSSSRRSSSATSAPDGVSSRSFRSWPASSTRAWPTARTRRPTPASLASSTLSGTPWLPPNEASA
jgi:hypothetical protein